MVNVDVRGNVPNLVCFVGLSAGGKSLVAWREPHGQPEAGRGAEAHSGHRPAVPGGEGLHLESAVVHPAHLVFPTLSLSP